MSSEQAGKENEVLRMIPGASHFIPIEAPELFRGGGSSVPRLSPVRLLGHASITTTERYDNQKLENLQAAAARLERGETFDPGRRETATRSICQVSVKSSVDEEPWDEIDRVREARPKYGKDLDLEDWLGIRDDFRNWLALRAA